MGTNFRRLFLFLLVCILGQTVISYAISYVCVMLGIYNPMLILILVDVSIGFFLAWLYRPAGYRKGCLKDPDFYRDAGMFALIWIILDLVL